MVAERSAFDADVYGIPRHVAMKKGLPKRWTACPNFGDVIHNTFVPMKTPLSRGYDCLLDPQHMLHPEDVFSTTFNGASEGAKVKLWINLANTERYYGKGMIANHECRYEWLPLAGYKESPSVEQTEKFVEMVSEFKRKNPNDLIAVHCTHGINRTGFMIVSYLIRETKLDLATAVKEFADARSPGIYKEEYLADLCLRFIDGYQAGDALPFTVPAHPTWD
uniref:TYR_PHOSPHATASE_2 domain-containing protein n=1 Tax=Panagrellus redivivus TaxID=6233 RepID=A0A7E4V211_PANRE